MVLSQKKVIQAAENAETVQVANGEKAEIDGN